MAILQKCSKASELPIDGLSFFALKFSLFAIFLKNLQAEVEAEVNVPAILEGVLEAAVVTPLRDLFFKKMRTFPKLFVYFFVCSFVCSFVRSLVCRVITQTQLTWVLLFSVVESRRKHAHRDVVARYLHGPRWR